MVILYSLLICVVSFVSPVTNFHHLQDAYIKATNTSDLRQISSTNTTAEQKQCVMLSFMQWRT